MSTANGAEPASLAGRLLVASDAMTDPRFVRTVIYMVSHDEAGALGVIVNRPLTEITLGELLRDMGRPADGAQGSIRVHFGGPVGGPQGFVLHTDEWRARDTRVVGGGIAFSTSSLVVEAMARGTGPRRTLFALGYAGWAPRQLEGEIARDAWITVAADEDLIFDDDAPTKWDRALARRKITL
jgi:putative transcriptional regulator